MITVTVTVEDRKLTPSSTNLGNENDNRYETIQFVVPEIFEQQSVFVCYQQADERLGVIMLDSSLTWDLGRYIMSAAGTLTIFLRIVSNDDRVWNSMPCRFKIKNLFDVDAENPPFDDADWLEKVLAEMAGYAATTEECKDTVIELHQEVVYNAAEVRSNTEIAQASAQNALSSAASALNSANDADASAEEAADQAAQAGRHAARAAQSAQDAADSAQEAQESADGLDFPQVEVTTLMPGQQATAQWNLDGENPVLELGLPKGRDGTGAGDMVKADYDSNNDGVVNRADTITGSIRMDQVDGLVGHVTDYANPHNVTARQTGAATAMAFEAVLLASGWVGESAPYSQVVAVEGILETDAPVVAMALTGNETVDGPTREAWAKISRMATGSGTITAYAWEKPEVNIPIVMQVTRGNGKGFGGSLSATAIQMSASGDIVTIEDAGAVPAVSAVAMIEPVQEGEGEPYPPGGGKNLLPNTATSQTINDVTFTVNEDGSITVNGMATNSILYNISAFQASGGEYILSGCPQGGGNIGMSLILYGTDSQYGPIVDPTITFYNGGEPVTLTWPDNIAELGWYLCAQINIDSGATVSGTFYPMLRLASETDPTYAPYANIRPITGHEGCGMVRAGKNLVSAEFTSYLFEALPSSSTIREQAFSIAPGHYVLSVATNTGISRINVLSVTLHDSDNNVIKNINSGSNNALNGFSTFSVSADEARRCARIRIFYNAPNDTNRVDGEHLTGFQIETGSTATDYAPYQGSTHTAAFPQTVYGGSYDFVSGRLTVDRAMVTLDGTEGWNTAVTAVENVYRPAIGIEGISGIANSTVIANIQCSHYKTVAATVSYSSPEKYGISQQGDNSTAVYLNDPAYATSDTAPWKAYLAAQYAAGTPVRVCYELKTPLTYDLTPQQVDMLFGTNNVWSDTGESRVVYVADTKLYIDRKIMEALEAMNG